MSQSPLMVKIEATKGQDPTPQLHHWARILAGVGCFIARPPATHWHAWELIDSTLHFVGCFPNPQAAWDAAGVLGRVREYRRPGT